MKKNLISILVSIIIIWIIFYYIIGDKWEIIFNVNFIHFFGSIAISFLLHQISGQYYRLVQSNFKFNFKPLELFFFPHVQSFWGFLFPFQGSAVFVSLFLKKKHKLSISKSLSFTSFLFSITIFISGLITALYFKINKLLTPSYLMIFALSMLLPLFIYLLKIILSRLKSGSLFNPAYFFVSQIVELFMDKKLLLKCFILDFILLILNGLWFYYISTILSLNFFISDCFFIAVICNVSLILKFTPGNIGINQLLSGGTMALLNKSPEGAILLTLFASVTTIVLNTVVGLIGNYYYFKTINIRKLFIINKKF